MTSSAALVAALCIVPSCSRTSVRAAGEPRQSVGPVAPPAIPAGPASRWTTAVLPKALSETVRKGIEWLLEHQRGDGGWSQGEESAQMGRSMDGVRDVSNVADSCIAALALVRSGEGFDGARYAKALERAVAFVCGKVEASDADSLSVTDVHGTRVQGKIGTHVDTFLASMLLSEVQERLPGAEANQRAKAALAKVLHKIQRNQQAGGTWDNAGWAPVLSQSLAGKGLNRASQVGAGVDSKVLDETLRFAMSGPGDAVPAAVGSAGVTLYAESAALGVLQENANTGVAREKDLRDRLEKCQDDAERQLIADEISKIAVFRRACSESQQSVVDRLDDPGFVSGFGSNGGEEFLSYMNISESLVLRGDEAWTKWDQGVASNLARVQNQDGSWTGHHCITGRTFCTGAALLALMADRTPVPAESVKRG